MTMYEADISADAGYIDLGSAEWGIDPNFNSYIAAHRNGLCLIAKEKGRDNDIREALIQLEKQLGITLNRKYATMEDISEARRLGKAGDRSGASDGMQGKILDLIDAAYKARASDIHIEIATSVTYVRFRVDGRIVPYATWASSFGRNFLGAAYVMADLANSTYSPTKYLAARLAPREGRDQWAFPEGVEAVRMQFNPIAFGVSYAVFRLLGVTRNAQSIEQLGYEPEQLPVMTSFALKSKGLGIISGPTGSGKSTTMCALIDRTRQIDIESGNQRALFTVEDPPERRLIGAQQLVVNNTDTDEERAKAFADAIRAAMRSDPDQIVIGEIRDRITADLALSASMTGHQVWSTLHCTSAHSIPLRLIDLGVDRSKIFGSDELYVAAAQVLVPLLCPNCKTSFSRAIADGKIDSIEAAVLERAFGTDHFFPGQGCETCGGSGVKGRTVIAEVIRTDAEYLDVLNSQGMAAAKHFSISRGEPSMAIVGQRKVARGIVCARDVAKMVNIEELHNTNVKMLAA